MEVTSSSCHLFGKLCSRCQHQGLPPSKPEAGTDTPMSQRRKLEVQQPAQGHTHGRTQVPLGRPLPSAHIQPCLLISAPHSTPSPCPATPRAAAWLSQTSGKNLFPFHFFPPRFPLPLGTISPSYHSQALLQGQFKLLHPQSPFCPQGSGRSSVRKEAPLSGGLPQGRKPGVLGREGAERTRCALEGRQGAGGVGR